MATVDSLLSIIGARNAEALTIGSAEVPVLTKGGARAPLSMPPLAAALVEVFVTEVLDDDQRARLDDTGSVETKYISEKGEFWAKVKRQGDGFKLAFRALEGSNGTAAAAAQPSAPAAPQPHPVTTPSAGASAGRVGEVRPATSPPPSPQLHLVREAPAAEDLSAIMGVLHRAQMEHASDILISSGRCARMRVDNHLLELPECLPAEAAVLGMFGDYFTERLQAQLIETGSCDFAFDLRDRDLGRYRVNVFRQLEGIAAALRPIRGDAPTLASLGLPKDLYRLVRYPHGLVLVAGQTGSGKSTTLAALLEYINRVDAKHIITIEDPIEYHYRPQQSLVHQREVGTHVASFASGLRAALRESPDIILVGEMRDPETMAAALTAAETGHLVLSTIHSADGIMAIDRIIDSFPPHQQRQVRSQLSMILQAVLSQRLLPKLGGGRIPAWETMFVNPAVAAMIRDDKAYQIRSQIQIGKTTGMMPMDRVIRGLLQDGLISRDVAEANYSDEA